MNSNRNERWTRRDALKLGASATLAASLPGWFLESSRAETAAHETSPNARPRVAWIGCGGMGTGDATKAVKFGDIIAVCDVDATHLGKAREKYRKAKAYRDYREVCDLSDVDVVIN